MVADLSPEAWRQMQNFTNKVIKRVHGSGITRPTCVAKVHLSKTDTMTKRRRVAKAMQEGRDPTVCGCRALWTINGKPYCQGHAGQEAINTLVIIANGGNL